MIFDATSRLAFRAGPHFRPVNKISLAAACAALLTGCVSSVVPSLREPARLYDTQTEMTAIQESISPLGLRDEAITTKEARNAYITLRMYAIDQNYTVYESQLTHETQETGLTARLINLGLTGAASVSPTADVGKALSAAATGLTGAEAAYDEKILLSQSIQNLETEMRADRSAQGAVILANMRCPLGQYNLGMALSDLEEYYRAGTLPSAMIALSKTVANAENVAKATKASMNPAPRVAQAGLDRTDQAHSIDTQPLAVQDGNGCSQGSADVGVIPFPKAHPRKSAAAPETCETLGSELVADQSRLADPVIRNRMRDVALKRRKMGCPAISVG